MYPIILKKLIQHAYRNIVSNERDTQVNLLMITDVTSNWLIGITLQ